MKFTDICMVVAVVAVVRGGGGLHGKFMPTIIPPSYGLFAESRRVCSLQNYFGSNWCETTHFFRQGMNSSQQVIAKLGHVVQTDVFCLP